MNKVYLLVFTFLVSNLIFSQAISTREQEKRQVVFNHVPDTIQLTDHVLSALFEYSQDKSVDIELAKNQSLAIEGTVVAKSSKYGNQVNSITIQTSDNRILLLTHTILPDGAVKYSGMLMKKLSADILLLYKIGDQYYFIKKEWNELVNE